MSPVYCVTYVAGQDPGFDLSPAGRGEKEPLQPKFIAL